MLSTATPMAFLTGAAMPYVNSRTCVAPMMKMTRKQRKQQQVQSGSSTPPGVFPDETTGVVVPTGGVTTEAPAEGPLHGAPRRSSLVSMASTC